MPNGVTIITPTGGRPWAFARCCEYVRRQVWSGDLQWIVVDDGLVPLEPPEVGFTQLTWIRASHRWVPGMNTLPLNLLTAIPWVAYGHVLFFEDDDWYSPYHVARLMEQLEKAEIAGEARAKYYHVPRRLWRQLPNAHHASLCQTGIRSSLLPLLQKICLRPSASFIDIQLWEGQLLRGLIPTSISCVGLKGLPGRQGIGIGHRPEAGDWNADPEATTLRQWIGEDADVYLEAAC